jgi:hypothetical protein
MADLTAINVNCLGANLILDSSAVLALINPLDTHCRHARELSKADLHKLWVMHEVSLAECLVRATEKDTTDEVLALRVPSELRRSE